MNLFIQICKISHFYKLKETIQGSPKLLLGSIYKRDLALNNL